MIAATGAASAAGSALPATMQAMAIDQAGGPEVLTLHTLPVPKPAAEEVVIALHAAGVAVWDVYLRQHPQENKNSAFPYVLGTDGAGVVAALGSHVHGLKVGDEVYSYSWDNEHGGFYAQYVAVPAVRVARVPGGLTLTEAGAIGTTALTAIQGIDDALHVKKGDAVIIHGAAGGVGTLAVQFARLRGARVLAIASGEDELALARKLGADAVVDGRQGDVTSAVHAFAPGGADALLALASGDALVQAMAALRPGATVAYPHGVSPAPQPREGLRIVGYDAVPGPAEFARLNTAIEAAHLSVPIAAQFPLSEAAQAQARVAAGHVLGKVVLLIN
jgi:NADPH:quinone reductase